MSPDEVKEAGRKLLKFYHPDKNMNNPDYDSEKFYKVYEAYETLGDEEREKSIMKHNDSYQIQ
jgi:DnaJ-class molecular chaperone